MTDAPPHHHHHHHHAAPTAPPVSLLRMSLLDRLVWAAAAVGLIWAGVFWAMR
jgi:hypothetical protein